MKMKIEVNVEPFEIPRSVRIDGDGDQVVPLVEVDPATLSALCDEFREHVFASARKDDPRLKS